MSEMIGRQSTKGNRKGRHAHDRRTRTRAGSEASERSLRALAGRINARVLKAESVLASARSCALRHAVELGQLPLVRICRPAASALAEKVAREPAAARLPPAPYDRLMRRQCAISNQGSRRRRFSMWPPRWQYYANHRNNRLAARMGQTKKCLFSATIHGAATYTNTVAERSPLLRAAVSAPWATTSPAHRETAASLQ
jgi:hypothetical protein